MYPNMNNKWCLTTVLSFDEVMEWEALQPTRGCLGGVTGEKNLVGSGETNMIG